MKYKITARRTVDVVLGINLNGAYYREVLEFYVNALSLQTASEKAKQEVIEIWKNLEWVGIDICQIDKED